MGVVSFLQPQRSPVRLIGLVSRCVLVCVVAVFWSLGIAAAARADTGSIAGLHWVTNGQLEATFTETHPPCGNDPNGYARYCGWFALATITSPGQPCDTSRIAWSGGLQPAGGTRTEIRDFYGFNAPTDVCLFIYADGVYQLVDRQEWLPPPEHLDAIPTVVGARSSGSYLISTGNTPPTVNFNRFSVLAARSGARWGIRFVNYTANPPAVDVSGADGVSEAGFSDALADGVLGQHTIVYRRRASRVIRKCHRTRHGRRCTRRIVHRAPTILDVDVAVNANAPWQQGPAYPSDTQFDLETTLLHEFGHAAGNGHVYGCEDSPLRDVADYGDFWRSYADWFRRSCASPSAASRAAPYDGLTPSRRSRPSRQWRWVSQTYFVPPTWHAHPTKAALMAPHR